MILVVSIINFSLDNLNLLNVFSFKKVLIKTINNNNINLAYRSLLYIIKIINYKRIKIIKKTPVSRYLLRQQDYRLLRYRLKKIYLIYNLIVSIKNLINSKDNYFILIKIIKIRIRTKKEINIRSEVEIAFRYNYSVFTRLKLRIKIRIIISISITRNIIKKYILVIHPINLRSSRL